MGAGPLSVLVEGLGWRKTMWLIGGILMVIALLIGFLVRDNPAAHHGEPEPSEEYGSHISFWDAFTRVLKNHKVGLTVFMLG